MDCWLHSPNIVWIQETGQELGIHVHMIYRVKHVKTKHTLEFEVGSNSSVHSIIEHILILAIATMMLYSLFLHLFAGLVFKLVSSLHACICSSPADISSPSTRF